MIFSNHYIGKMKKKVLPTPNLERGEIGSTVTNLGIHTPSNITQKENLHLSSLAVKITVLELSSVIMWIHSFTDGFEIVVIVDDVLV